MATPCTCNDGWVCEEHPTQPMHHQRNGQRCNGAGQPCENPKCPHGRRALASKPINEAIDRERYRELFDAKTGRRKLDHTPIAENFRN